MNSHPSRAHFRSPGSDIDEFLELLSKMFAQSHTRELKISTYAEYESTIKYFGRPILPPRLTEKEVSDMRRLKALLPTNRPNIAEGPRKSRSASVNVAHTSEVRLSAVTQDGAMRNKRSPAKATPQRLRLPRETPAASHVSGTAKSSSGANVSGILPQSPLSPKHRQRQHHPHDDATYPPAAVAVEPPHEVYPPLQLHLDATSAKNATSTFRTSDVDPRSLLRQSDLDPGAAHGFKMYAYVAQCPHVLRPWSQNAHICVAVPRKRAIAVVLGRMQMRHLSELCKLRIHSEQ
eukprot:m.1221423 g.1221423  ORF g.1221423 m.1221423 type:complete len:291 (-) comp24624_c0_seq24:3633-4505(-)